MRSILGSISYDLIVLLTQIDFDHSKHKKMEFLVAQPGRHCFSVHYCHRFNSSCGLIFYFRNALVYKNTLLITLKLKVSYPLIIMSRYFTRKPQAISLAFPVHIEGIIGSSSM